MITRSGRKKGKIDDFKMTATRRDSDEKRNKKMAEEKAKQDEEMKLLKEREEEQRRLLEEAKEKQTVRACYFTYFKNYMLYIVHSQK